MAASAIPVRDRQWRHGNLQRSVTTGALTQSGGLLNGTGTLTVSGLSTLSGGTESGAGTTIAQGGAAFSTTSFSLDGGRTLQLGGTSTATGTKSRST